MKKLFKIIIVFALLMLTKYSFAQINNKSKITKAKNHLDNYLKQVRFEDGITPESVQEFQKLFETGSRIVFDIPFRDTELQNTEIKRISKDDRQQLPVINVYGKMVTVDLYTDIVKREMGMEGYNLTALNYTINYTGRKDSSKAERDTIISEVFSSFLRILKIFISPFKMRIDTR